jgi:hypothetical protein
MTTYNKAAIPAEARNPESRLIAEYVAEKFSAYRVTLRQPLGEPVVPAESGLSMTARLRASRPWRPEVDAVVVFGEALLLIEAKVDQYLFGISKLPFYASLVKRTPELAPWAALEIRMRLVCPVDPTWLLQVAEEHNVEIDVYRPAWIEGWLDYQAQYWSRESRLRRAERRQAVERLGL